MKGSPTKEPMKRRKTNPLGGAECVVLEAVRQLQSAGPANGAQALRLVMASSLAGLLCGCRPGGLQSAPTWIVGYACPHLLCEAILFKSVRLPAGDVSSRSRDQRQMMPQSDLEVAYACVCRIICRYIGSISMEELDSLLRQAICTTKSLLLVLLAEPFL